MKCRHGINGRCPQCDAESARGELLMELAHLTHQLAVTAGLDTSHLEALMRRLR